MYSFGLIGNCQVSALVSRHGALEWLCLPRPDSEPVFGRLLDPKGGHFAVELEDYDSSLSVQRYIENTNVLVTELSNARGDKIRITDFCPRYEQFGRMYRPAQIFRKVEPLAGSPRIRVECRPVQGWSKVPALAVRGSNHLRFDLALESLRLTTNMPLTEELQPYPLKQPIFLLLGWAGVGGGVIEEDLTQLYESSLLRTTLYWQSWVRHCSIPSLFQSQTIRSALALKLHCFEDTGAILAALTTSLPEEPGATRNWDYRFCWLRDAHFALTAFHNLGHFDEMEGFLKFLLAIAEKQEASRDRLAPVYTLGQRLPLPEVTQDQWAGFAGSLPVRVNNQAAEHVQNDVYGEMVLTLAPIFFDERLIHLRNPEHERLLVHLARLCARSIGEADAGLWEVRNHWQQHTFTHLMCWAGLERTQRIRPLDLEVARACDLAVAAVEKGVMAGALRNGPADATLDAALVLAGVLRFPRPELVLSTVRAVQSELSLVSGVSASPGRPHSSFFYRYRRKDDFGKPQSAFLVCSFWVAQALARLGEFEEARAIVEDAAGAANSLGLFSEHYDPVRRLQLGNFPQAYSHVGLINAAFAVSPPWSEVL
ncbi:MAG: glycoside hydrolase family 15 protein [Oligoflexia bacterium]